MTGRPRTELGDHGKVTFSRKPSGSVEARVTVRDRDGRSRAVRSSGPTKGAAERALKRKLAQRVVPNQFGLKPEMTIEQAAAYWMELRTKGAKESAPESSPPRGARLKGTGRRPLKPRTVDSYSSEIRRTILPTLGQLRLSEVTVGLLDSVLADLEDTGISTRQMRSVLSQIFGLAVRHGIQPHNLMALVEPLYREPLEVEALELEEIARLRHLVDPKTRRKPGQRGPNGDLADLVDVGLGTGARIGEILAIQWRHACLTGSQPTVEISGTLIEPRRDVPGLAKLHRQDSTKSREVRTLILPDHVVDVLTRRRAASKFTGKDDPVFASRTGKFLWPSNLRTRLREAVKLDEDLLGTTPHSLRRTVGTHVTRELGLDAARDQLGHRDGSITFQRYVAARPIAPDLRTLFDTFFT